MVLAGFCVDSKIESRSQLYTGGFSAVGMKTYRPRPAALANSASFFRVGCRALPSRRNRRHLGHKHHLSVRPVCVELSWGWLDRPGSHSGSARIGSTGRIVRHGQTSEWGPANSGPRLLPLAKPAAAKVIAGFARLGVCLIGVGSGSRRLYAFIHVSKLGTVLQGYMMSSERQA